MSQRKYLSEKIKLGDKDLIVETGKVAKQADGAVVVRYGDTMILVTAVSARTAKEGLDFFRSPSNIVNQVIPLVASREIISAAKVARTKRKF